jgi:hypothetical protein
MANKQTAVDRLYIHLLGIVSFDSEQLRNMYEESFKQAKEMEQDQMAKQYKKGWNESAEYLYKKFKEIINGIHY